MNENLYLRLFVGLPIALHIGFLTAPVIVCDGAHYRTPSYTGKLFSYYAKDGYGKPMLLSFAVIPKECVRHLGWVVECNIHHGISVKFVQFTDQGHLLATAAAFVCGVHGQQQKY